MYNTLIKIPRQKSTKLWICYNELQRQACSFVSVKCRRSKNPTVFMLGSLMCCTCKTPRFEHGCPASANAPELIRPVSPASALLCTSNKQSTKQKIWEHHRRNQHTFPCSKSGVDSSRLSNAETMRCERQTVQKMTGGKQTGISRQTHQTAASVSADKKAQANM